jgi:hypothetical protein
MWLTKLQIAIIEKNPEAISKLVSEMPNFESVEEMKSASSLIKEALKLLHTLKDETGAALVKLKKHKDFLAATETKKVQRLDITS